MTITAPEADIDTTTGDREPCQGVHQPRRPPRPCDQPAEFEHIWDKRCCRKTSRTVHCRACSDEGVRQHAERGATCMQCGSGPVVLVMVVPL